LEPYTLALGCFPLDSTTFHRKSDMSHLLFTYLPSSKSNDRTCTAPQSTRIDFTPYIIHMWELLSHWYWSHATDFWSACHVYIVHSLIKTSNFINPNLSLLRKIHFPLFNKENQLIRFWYLLLNIYFSFFSYLSA